MRRSVVYQCTREDERGRRQEWQGVIPHTPLVGLWGVHLLFVASFCGPSHDNRTYYYTPLYYCASRLEERRGEERRELLCCKQPVAASTLVTLPPVPASSFLPYRLPAFSPSLTLLHIKQTGERCAAGTPPSFYTSGTPERRFILDISCRYMHRLDLTTRFARQQPTWYCEQSCAFHQDSAAG
jgi:hypothetical protein